MPAAAWRGKALVEGVEVFLFGEGPGVWSGTWGSTRRVASRGASRGGALGRAVACILSADEGGGGGRRRWNAPTIDSCRAPPSLPPALPLSRTYLSLSHTLPSSAPASRPPTLLSHPPSLSRTLLSLLSLPPTHPTLDPYQVFDADPSHPHTLTPSLTHTATPSLLHSVHP